MGSSLQIESEVGRGSRFWLDLWLPESSNRPATDTFAEKVVIGYKSADLPNGESYKVLVIDDKTENRFFLRDALRPLAFEVLEAVDGYEALRLIEQHHPHIILVDLRMPGIDGLELTQRIRCEWSGPVQPVIIAVSASAFEETRQASLTAGCDDFIPKPVRLSSLLEILGKHLSLHWIQKNTHRPGAEELPSSTANAIVVPPSPQITTLYDLTMRGDISGILEEAARIEQSNAEFNRFVAKIRQLAKGYQINKLQEFVGQYVE